MNSRILPPAMNRTDLLKQLPDHLRARFPTIPATDWSALGMLALASGAACGLWLLRVLLKERLHHAFLPWNLFLAWLPLLFALLALHFGQRSGWRSWPAWLAAGAWLLFFPNAPYLFTDLTHLDPSRDHRFWMDLIMILLFAWPAFLVGCLSLKLLHAPVAARFGMIRGWLFVGGVCGLAGVGVYLGRFLRWNSGDVLTNPLGLALDLLAFLGHSPTHPAYRFSLLFGFLLFIGYALQLAGTRQPAATNSHVPRRAARADASKGFVV
jgi:uncharacterized membrane protein